MLKQPETLVKFPKRSLSNLFQRKSSLENLCSFLSPKEKFRFLCNGKDLPKEFDSKLDDVFIPREYQEKIKSYQNYIEELFYQILHQLKRNAENKGQKIILYEFENDLVKYLKYLVNKYDKIIKISLTRIYNDEPWKIDFVSKLLLALDKNVHLVMSMNLSEFKMNDCYLYYIKPSKAINILEIVDIIYNPKDILLDEYLKTIFVWSHIKKIIINSVNINWTKYNNQGFGYKFLNSANIPKLVELDFRCKNSNIHYLEHFMIKCSEIKKLNVEYVQFENQNQINDNSVLKFYKNITDLKITTNIDNLAQILYYFYPIFPKIKTFHLVIDNDKNELSNSQYDSLQAKKIPVKNKEDNNDEYEAFAKKYLKNDDSIGDTRNISTKKISFSTEDFDIFEKGYQKKVLNFSNDTKTHKEKKEEEKEKINLIPLKIVSTLSNLTQCESLTYEIKEQKALIDQSKSINDLILLLEKNKIHLKYLEINIYNDKGIDINTNQFMALIQKISECKELNTFIFGFDLVEKYAEIFNEYFNIGNNLNKIQIVHSTKLNVMKIINEHLNLNSINLELIMDEPDYTIKNYEKLEFDLNNGRDWKEIELTNYPINSANMDYLRNKKDISICLNVCVNLTEMDDLIFKEVMKTFIN